MDGPFLAVTHSFGTMRLLADVPPNCRGILAINGFDRFAASQGFPGVPIRMVERMISRFDEVPEAVLADFRLRCGCDTAFGAIDAARLLDDLVALRDGDHRDKTARCGLPILSFQGAHDPILPSAMREAVFASAANCQRQNHPTAGHLLPIEDPATCAEAISAFMESLS